MVQIDLDNIFVKVTGMDKEDELVLWDRVSFAVQEFGMQEVRYRHLFNRKTKKAYAGLLPYVIDVCKERGIEYKLIDHRIKHEQNADFKLVEYIDEDKKIKLIPRDYQKEIIDNCSERAIIQAATGAGKAMPLDTDILTPDGFVKLKDIHVGSVVYDEKGYETIVTGEYPQKELKQEWQVTFKDGTNVKCCKDHMWKYKDKGEWKEDTIENIKVHSVIPVCKSIQFDKKELPIHPYVMGILLNVGEYKDGEMTVVLKQEIEDKVNGLISWGKISDGKLIFIGNRKKEYKNIFKKYFGEIFGLAKSKGKFIIPKEYKMSSVQDRMELFKGFVDIDWSKKLNKINISCREESLAKDLLFVVRSLGYRGSISKSIDSTILIIENKNTLEIVSIEKLETKSEMKCLTVDSSYHTFICKDFIVTHNTFMMAGLIAKFNVKPVCIFADKITLCIQLKNEMEKFLGTEVGLVGGGFKDYKDITVISLQSAEQEYIKDAKLCLWDECLPYNSNVLMQDGSYAKIGDLVENHTTKKVMTFNIKTRQIEPKVISGYSKKPIGDKKMMEFTVEFRDGQTKVFNCTDNHRIFINSITHYIKAKHIMLGQEVIVNYYGKPTHGMIIKKEVINFSGEYVYDIEVRDNHNFFTSDILVSNCHHIPANTTVTVANECVNAYYRIGVSATPWRDAGDEMLIEAVLSKRNPQYDIDASKLIQLGYLIKPKIFFVPVTEQFKGKNYNDVYNKAVVENVKRNKIIYKIATEMSKRNKKILILFKNIKHGEILQKGLLDILGEQTQSVIIKNPKNGQDTTIRVKNVELLSGSDNNLRRSAVIEAVKQKKCSILIASTIADEGLDLPILDTLILAGGGKSSTRAFQRIGRVIRLYEGKEKAIVFDFTDYTPMLRKHSRARQKLYMRESEWEIGIFNVVI